MRTSLLAPLLTVALALAGCATPRPTDLAVPTDRYTDAFAAARDELRDLGFSIERLDAAAGVITTRPKTSAGIATPADREQSSAGAEVDDLLHRQLRTVRVTFDPVLTAGEGAATEGAAGVPLTDARDRNADAAAKTVMRVESTVLRRQKPGWRVESTAVRLSSYTSDPFKREAGLEPDYDVVTGDDPLLSARIVAGVERRLGSGPGAAQP